MERARGAENQDVMVLAVCELVTQMVNIEV